MLTSRIYPPPSSQQSSDIDIFSSALAALFTDDVQNSHGTPGDSLLYASPTNGNLTLRIPAHPDVEEGRELFAHYLWTASVVAAEGIEQGSRGGEDGGDWDPQWWDVKGRRVLELGAGTALPSLTSALAGAASVTITDHPSSPALMSGAIASNVQLNLSPSRTSTKIDVCSYVWGESNTYCIDNYGQKGVVLGEYDKVILADCLWMPSQHRNLVGTIVRTLGRGQGCCAIAVAGFHTGRGVVTAFLDIAEGRGRGEEEEEEEAGEEGASGEEDLPRLRIVEIFEVDVDLKRRKWERERPGEGAEVAKRWCVVAILVRADM